MLSKTEQGFLQGIYRFRVEFFDVDSMNVVWHGNYVKYLEVARCAMLRDMNFSYIDMKENGFVMPIVKMDLKYIAPLVFNEEFFVEIRLVEWESFLCFHYELKNMQGVVICKASTAQVAVMIDCKETLFNLPDIMIKHIKNALNNAPIIESNTL